MNKKYLELKGSYKGVKKCTEMKQFDIMYSTIKCSDKKCYQSKKIIKNLINNVSIKKYENTYYIYHMYSALDDNLQIYYSGRWYNKSFKFTKKNINESNKYIQTEMIFENEDTFAKYNVEIKIYFTDFGWKKLTAFISQNI